MILARGRRFCFSVVQIGDTLVVGASRSLGTVIEQYVCQARTR